jgi:hypothetical protein
VAKVGGPPVLRVGHQTVEIFLESIVVKTLEGLSIIKLLGQRVGSLGVLTQDVKLQILWPPVAIPGATTSDVGGLVVNWAFTHDCFIKCIDICGGRGGVEEKEKESSEEGRIKKKKQGTFTKAPVPALF